MYQYTNGFSCALSGNGNEFVLCFAQQCPSFDSTDKLGKITKCGLLMKRCTGAILF